MAELTEPELWDALDGLMAYDTGAVDSGIHDEDLRRRVNEHLLSMGDDRRRVTLMRFLREHFLSETALVAGYGVGDLVEALEWLTDDMERYLGGAW